MIKLESNNEKDIVEMKNNHIYFYANVNRESIYKLVKNIDDITLKLNSLVNDYELEKPKIYIHINSFGGSLFAVLACIDKIKKSKIPIITIIEGSCASAATFISLMGHQRRMTKSSFMLIHQLSSSFWGKMSEIEDEFSNLQSLTKIIKDLYINYANLPKSGKYSLNSILKHDLWLSSDICKKLGLIDTIIE